MKRKYIMTVCVIILLFFLIIFGLCKFADVLPSKNDTLYIRGELTITPYSCKAEKTTGYMPTGVDYVNGSKSIIELQIGYYGGDMYPGLDQFQIKTYDCLGEA